jgi:hypothetical protein
VVHLAAIAAPGQVPEVETLALNVRGACLILDDAGRAGVKVAVAASSVAAYGYAWAERGLSPTTGSEVAKLFGRVPGVERDTSRLVMGCDNLRTGPCDGCALAGLEAHDRRPEP